MAIRLTIDHASKRVVAVADGDVTRRDLEEYLEAMDRENAMAYCKLFDGLNGDTHMDAYDLLAICVRIRAYHRNPVGPLAIVMTAEKYHLVLRILGALAAAKRPMKIFYSLKPAQRWLDSFATATSEVC
ncbi:MAG: hypothetical protein U1E21_10300 [Reyranellaceae bacterium]|jgi:CheY-like chemotaxis protein